MHYITSIPDMFWDDYCISVREFAGQYFFGTSETNRLGFTSAARWGQGHMNRVTLFFYCLSRMPAVTHLFVNLRDRRRDLYVR